MENTLAFTVLVDNTDGDTLKGEWGLSIFIEYGDKKILLDAGLSSLFADNAAGMGIDLSETDYAVLSHAHDDHANGFDRFFECNDHAPLYVARNCNENCYDKKGLFYKYAGIPKGIMQRHIGRIIRADNDMYIDSGIRLLGHTSPGLDRQGLMEKMYLRQGAFRFIPDDFRHEQSLIFELPDGIVIFNSCSHAGADVIIYEAMQAYPEQRILAMIGGFHLFNKSDEYVRNFARRVEATGVEKIYTGHCSGKKALSILMEELGDKVHAIKTGLVFRIN
jgi:7,8-dihydropterin-6-yl-methyl-4-(beta-D-ribofuranosyl)aminobenzene 5'-phosphate synthase